MVELSEEFADLLFPHDKVRDSQKQLIRKIFQTLKDKKHLLAHAPTGLGKTAAALSPAIKFAIDNDKTVIFVTSRHTQHLIALETVKKISDKYDMHIPCTNIIGKKWMCLQENVEGMYSSDFTEYCKSLKENGNCNYYSNLKEKDKLSKKAETALTEIKENKAYSTKEMKVISNKHEVCPYEIAMIKARHAKVIITDYYYVFHPSIRDNFFGKINKELSDCIIIVDEGHNVHERIKDLASERLTTNMIKRAITEAKKFGYENSIVHLEQLKDILIDLTPEDANESYISEALFASQVNKIKEYEELAVLFERIGDAIREEQKSSSIGGVASFLGGWKSDDEGYTRILSRIETKRDIIYNLSFRCLDPSIVAAPVIKDAYSIIIMSGTLTPIDMYKELLGFDNPEIIELSSPFPEKNKLNLIIPETSTKYSKRSDEQFENIAKVCSKVIDAVPGNSAIFFPSYYLKDEVQKRLKCKKTTFSEHPDLTRDQKEEMLNKFKTYSKVGACLLGVISGNFGEGIDLPGDYLKSVVIVGLPLQRPDLEAKALIQYYDEKFGKGWDYGYVLPAFTKTFQSAGRCIRSETDKGVIIFLDERYTWPNYFKCFPENWDIKISKVYDTLIRNFFGITSQNDAPELEPEKLPETQAPELPKEPSTDEKKGDLTDFITADKL